MSGCDDGRFAAEARELRDDCLGQVRHVDDVGAAAPKPKPCAIALPMPVAAPVTFATLTTHSNQ
jgi:hypothetical protein